MNNKEKELERREPNPRQTAIDSITTPNIIMRMLRDRQLEYLDECPKCHNIGIQFEHVQGPTSVTTTAKWCDCPLAKRHIAGLRSQTYPKARLALLMRDLLERMADNVHQ